MLRTTLRLGVTSLQAESAVIGLTHRERPNHRLPDSGCHYAGLGWGSLKPYPLSFRNPRPRIAEVVLSSVICRCGLSHRLAVGQSWTLTDGARLLNASSAGKPMPPPVLANMTSFQLARDRPISVAFVAKREARASASVYACVAC